MENNRRERARRFECAGHTFTDVDLQLDARLREPAAYGARHPDCDRKSHARGLINAIYNGASPRVRTLDDDVGRQCEGLQLSWGIIVAAARAATVSPHK